jgi:uncharacterized protein (AIM24 family)
MPVHDQLLGATQPVLSISLDPGESVVAEPAALAWMTDSIQLATGKTGLSTYTAQDVAGSVAFASRLPGTIARLDIDREYLIHRRGLLVSTPGVQVSTGLRVPLPSAGGAEPDFVLWRLGGRGRAWIDLSGDVVRHDLTAGVSLRTIPAHIGICAATIAVQVAELAGAASTSPDTRHVAVLSGPGEVWLQSTPTASASATPSAIGGARGGPAAEGAAGPSAPARASG